jgi:hypothetical protein
MNFKIEVEHAEDGRWIAYVGANCKTHRTLPQGALRRAKGIAYRVRYETIGNGKK